MPIDTNTPTVLDKALCLRNVDVFRHTTSEMLGRIGSIAREVFAQEGQVIFSEEDVSDAMYVIVTGHVRLTKKGDEVLTLGETNSFGTSALFDRQPRIMTAAALDDVRLLKIESEDFYDLLSGHEEITPAIFKSVIEKIRSLVPDHDTTPQQKIRTPLIQAETMASLGLLAAGVAHEINTPMGAIHSNNDILQELVDRMRKLTENAGGAPEMKQGADLGAMLAMLDEVCRNNAIATERIMEVVRSLKNFVRLDEAEQKKANIHDGMESTLMLLRHEFLNRIRVVKEYGELPEIECDPSQLNQLFLNLLVNAAQSIPGDGEIGIKTSCGDGTITIVVSDTGDGIAPENLTKVFEPGFTTKGVGVGTGLGLSICNQIVQDHHGKIEVESSDRGTVFIITLPQVRPQ